MLDFLWHLRGSVTLDGLVSNDAALTRVEQLLDRQGKTVTKLGPDFVEFNDPLWSNPFGANWLAMVIYDRGSFWIEQGPAGRRLRYDLRSLHGMVFCLFGAVMFFAFGLIYEGFVAGLQFAVLAFCWVYGMNVVLAFGRVPRSIRNAVRVA